MVSNELYWTGVGGDEGLLVIEVCEVKVLLKVD